jgi:hypothetical protein
MLARKADAFRSPGTARSGEGKGVLENRFQGLKALATFVRPPGEEGNGWRLLPRT